jgi:hypothetical protein
MMGIKVFVSESFHEQSHQSSSKEHSQSVFKGKGKLKIIGCCMHLYICEMMKDMSHHELVKNNDKKNCCINDSCCENY